MVVDWQQEEESQLACVSSTHARQPTIARESVTQLCPTFLPKSVDGNI
jgi:hypothetical protein